ncbi:hypothetical protein GGI12_001956 [Dipsacomyces acuminosporus]|nr:hypothetical protein GGI12_001956 [Dipsacomyces acuminosporus]
MPSSIKPEFAQSLRCKRIDTHSKYSDKIFLPASYLSALLGNRDRNSNSNSSNSGSNSNSDAFEAANLGQLPSPLAFRLGQRGSNAGGTAAFCGVREFSFDEGYVGIPDWLMAEAGLEDGSTAVVEFVRLEKGTFARLQALDQDSSPIADLRSLLESFMRTTLTVLFKGETIKVPVHGIAEPISFVVADLEPADAVDVVDTDLTVDIVYNHSKSSQGAVIHSGASTPDAEQVLAPNNDVDVVVQKDQTLLFQLHVPAGTFMACVEATCTDGDASLYASLLVRKAGPLDNTWFDHSPLSQKKKTLYIDGSALPSGSNNVHIAVVGYSPTCHARLRVLLDDANKQTEQAVAAQSADNLSSSDGLLRCANCSSLVPKERFDMHAIVCQRNNVKCPSCERIFKRGSDELKQHWHCDKCSLAGAVGDQEKHDQFYHSPCSCSCSPARVYDSIAELAEHRRSDCPERLIECRYCHNIEKQGPKSFDAEDFMLGLHSHEAYCGNRTIPCSKCKANVRIRQVQVHMRLHDMKDKAARASMVPCANRECSRERAPSNPLGLCSVCFGPFYSSEFDPKHLKLLKRLARTLHAQLTSGCGRASCRNLFCATGLRNTSAGASGFEPLTQTAAAAKMVPVLKAYAPLTSGSSPPIDYRSVDLHLCI